MKNYKTFYENIILDNIGNFSEYDIKEPKTELLKLQGVYSIFESEYLHPINVKRYGTKENCFKEWLQGLPSILMVPFYNNEILELAENHFDLTTEQKESTFLESYWFNLSKAFFTLLNNL